VLFVLSQDTPEPKSNDPAFMTMGHWQRHDTPLIKDSYPLFACATSGDLFWFSKAYGRFSYEYAKTARSFDFSSGQSPDEKQSPASPPLRMTNFLNRSTTGCPAF
jgi:hypothetical protein